MIVAQPSGLWRSLDPIGLDELIGRAALETRTDRKYVVPPGVIDEIVAGLGRDLRVLEIDGARRFAYETVYFDTAELDAYRDAARSRPKRFKVRTRTYLDSAATFLEVKVRNGREQTVKHRLAYSFEDRWRLTDPSRCFAGVIIGNGLAAGLIPMLANRYDRRTILLPDADARATIDADFRCIDLEGGGRAELAGAVIVETKTTGAPGPLDRLLWRTGYRPAKISKYGTGLAVARPGLPANKWHRTIVRHLRRRVDGAADPLAPPGRLTLIRTDRIADGGSAEPDSTPVPKWISGTSQTASPGSETTAARPPCHQPTKQRGNRR
jgi:hypothetical protein